MINASRIRTFSICFAVICFICLGLCLANGATLPTRAVYKTYFGTVTATTGGSFDSRYFAPVILYSFGAFWGTALAVSIKVEKKDKKKVKDEPCQEEQKKETAEEPSSQIEAAPQIDPKVE